MKNELLIKNVLVTGAQGKIGRSLVPRLVDEGFNVRAVQFNEDEPVLFDGVEIIEGDLRDQNFAKKALPDMDAVIHLAHVKENREQFLQSCVNGTFWLLDEVMKRKHIKQFIQAGSDARAGIFYYPQPIPIDETHIHSAYPGYYAFSKVLEEVMCEQYRIQYNTPITVLRFSWVHDEDDILAHVTLKEPNFGVPIWEEIAKTPKQKEYFTNNQDAVAMLVHPGGKPGIRHIVGIKDVVDGILLSLGNKAAVGKSFNICGPSPFSYDVLAKYISQKMGLPIVEFELEDFYDFSINISLARSVLGYNPKYDIFAIVDDAIAFRESGKKRTKTKYIG